MFSYESLFVNVCFITDLRCLYVKTSLLEQLKICLLADVSVTYLES